MELDMQVLKRNGTLEEMMFDKILTRVRRLGNNAGLTGIQYQSLVIKIIEQLYDKIPSTKIDELLAEQCATMSSKNYDYSVLAGQIVVSNHQKNTTASFSEAMTCLRNNTSGVEVINQEFYEYVQANALILDAMIDYSRDFLIDYFGFKTLEKAYLLKSDGKTVERPQHMWMRVAVAIHKPCGLNCNPSFLERIKETYDLMSLKYFTHATPTLFNAGTPTQQLSSCYLIAMESDSIEGIYNTLKDCALISKYSGGIGMHIHNIRSKGSLIKGTNGKTDGIVPMLRVFNNTARYVNQSGKRNGSFAIYLEPWHSDIYDFLELKKNHGDEESKARDLFYALWMPDLFMERVKTNENWSLMCPHESPGLADVFGREFESLYTKYEAEGRFKRVVPARELWFKILDAQMETGTPYLLYKDAANRKSNQRNLGTIKSSNLCCEIMEYSSPDETAVCNLASIALPTFVRKLSSFSDTTVFPRNDKTVFDFEKLHQVVKVITRNLDRVIDINYYPTEKTRTSNFKHRPIGIGVQGLADVFMMQDMAFHSDEAKKLNKLIFETIYHAALEASMELALEKGRYSSFEGSPASQGLLQFDLWEQPQTDERYNWTELKDRIKTVGLRNSLLVAPMPTASTSQILGFNECFEPFTSNLYTRRTLAGEFVVVNRYLMAELMDLGLWNEQIKNNIIANKGSVQQLTMLPEHIRNKYKIVWEIPMKHLIDMAADRGAFICQSQSLNLWLEDPTYNTLTSMHFYSWKKGLKTGIYYLRRKARHQAQQFTIEPTLVEEGEHAEERDEICEMCSA